MKSGQEMDFLKQRKSMKKNHSSKLAVPSKKARQPETER